MRPAPEVLLCDAAGGRLSWICWISCLAGRNGDRVMTKKAVARGYRLEHRDITASYASEAVAYANLEQVLGRVKGLGIGVGTTEAVWGAFGVALVRVVSQRPVQAQCQVASHGCLEAEAIADAAEGFVIGLRAEAGAANRELVFGALVAQASVNGSVGSQVFAKQHAEAIALSSLCLDLEAVGGSVTVTVALAVTTISTTGA